MVVDQETKVKSCGNVEWSTRQGSNTNAATSTNWPNRWSVVVGIAKVSVCVLVLTRQKIEGRGQWHNLAI